MKKTLCMKPTPPAPIERRLLEMKPDLRFAPVGPICLGFISRPKHNRAVDMMADREVLMESVAEYFAKEDIVGSINLTNESQVRILTKENQDLRSKLHDLRAENLEIREKNDAYENRIANLERLLAEKRA